MINSWYYFWFNNGELMISDHWDHSHSHTLLLCLCPTFTSLSGWHTMVSTEKDQFIQEMQLPRVRKHQVSQASDKLTDQSINVKHSATASASRKVCHLLKEDLSCKRYWLQSIKHTLKAMLLLKCYDSHLANVACSEKRLKNEQEPPHSSCGGVHRREFSEV